MPNTAPPRPASLLRADVTSFLLARGAHPLRRRDGMSVVAEAQMRGHSLAAEIIRAWIRRAAS